MNTIRLAASISISLSLALGAISTTWAHSDEHHHDEDKYEHHHKKHNRNDEHDDKDHRKQVRIVLEEVAVSAWDDNVHAGVRLQLQNIGNKRARDVRITHVKIYGGGYEGPSVLPVALGDLAADEDAFFDALLRISWADGTARELHVDGDYRDGHEHERHHFHIRHVISPSSKPLDPIVSVPGISIKQDPGHAVYPAKPVAVTDEPNAESPIFIPLGPVRQVFPPTPTGTSIGTSAGGASVSIPVNTSMANAGFPPDPNAAAASAQGVVLSSYNTGISYSLDGGLTFTDVALTSPQTGNPSRTSFFPESDSGLCCDQVLVYIPKQNLFVWLLQYWPTTAAGKITQTNRLRVAWATPAGIKADFWNAWTYADLTGNSVPNVSDGFGINGNEWMDYPDMAWSSTFLYVGIDHGSNSAGKVFTGRRLVARLSLADMANTAATVVHYDRAELTGSNGLNKTHFIQNAPGKMVVGSLDNTSTMRVFTWDDGNNSIPSSTVGVSSITTAYASTDPDGVDWYGSSFPGNITGGVFRSVFTGLGSPNQDEYMFAFDGGTNGSGRPRPFVRLESLTPTSSSNYKIASEYDIWNSDYAYGTAGLGTDGTEVGITLGVGSGTLGYPQNAVGFKNDFVVYQVTNSNATQSSTTAVRFGDYFSTRLVPDSGTFFAAEVYETLLNTVPPGTTIKTCAVVGCTAKMRYVMFGRPQAPGPR